MTIAMFNLLAKVRPSDVETEPFPHVVVKDALEPDLYARLAATFPAYESLCQGEEPGSNLRFHYDARKVVGDSELDPSWAELARVHLASSFFQDFNRLFGDLLLHWNPTLGRTPGRLSEVKVGVRGIDPHPQADVLLDFLVACNTPVVGKPTSVRGAHVDLPNKLFTGLFYMRAPEDDSQGGDLELCRFKSDVETSVRGRNALDAIGGSEVPAEYVECVKTVPYQTNVFVLFLNSPQSLHGVSRRSVTSFPRRFVCVLGQIQRDQFGISKLQGS